MSERAAERNFALSLLESQLRRLQDDHPELVKRALVRQRESRQSAIYAISALQAVSHNRHCVAQVREAIHALETLE